MKLINKLKSVIEARSLFRNNVRMFETQYKVFEKLYKKYGGTSNKTKDGKFYVGYTKSTNDLDYRYDIEDERLFLDEKNQALLLYKISGGKSFNDKDIRNI